MQADTIVRRYPETRIASLRLGWCISKASDADVVDPDSERCGLWAYVQEDAAAKAILQAADLENRAWSGHEKFFIVAPDPTHGNTTALWGTHWRNVPIKAHQSLDQGFFNCSKARRLLGWVHTPREGCV